MKDEGGKKFSFWSLLPFVILLIYAIVVYLVIGRLPSAKELLGAISDFYGRFGYFLVFFAAVFEATFLLGLYVPGTTVILFGAALSNTGVISFPVVILLGTVGLLAGYTTNYFLGKYGWYHVLTRVGFANELKAAQNKLTKHGGKAIFLGYLFPNSAAFLSTSAGILNMPFGKFLMQSILAQAFWSVVWGSVAYVFGFLFVELFMKYFAYIIWGLVGVYIIWKYVLKR